MTQRRGSPQVTRAERLTTRGRKLLDDWEDETDIDRAEVLFRQAIEIVPELGEAWRGLGDVLWENEEYDQALIAYHRSHALGVNSAALWRRMGTAYAHAHDRDHHTLSIDAIERALVLAPADAHVLEDFEDILDAGDLWEQSTLQQRILGAVEQANMLAPTDPGVLREYINVLLALGKRGQPALLERVVEVTDHLLALVPPNVAQPWTLNPLLTQSGVLCTLGHLESALAAIDHYANLANQIPGVVGILKREAAHTRRAVILDHMGRHDEALADIEQYLKTATEPKILWRAFYAQLLAHVGRLQESLQAIEATLAADESKLMAYPLSVRAEILGALGRIDEAAASQQLAQTREQQSTPLHELIPSA